MIERKTSLQVKRAAQRTAQQAYPFAAIVGQEEMKLALLLNVIDPLIGGVLIMGHRGTGKSTAVRAIADLLPLVWKVTNCHYGCDPAELEDLCNDCFEKLGSEGKLTRTRTRVPVVTLPLGATEDRVCGTIDIQRALKEGVKSFEPGLLARANRGFLYVDEVNLLDDHLVDLLLDVAVTGRNTVEREGISLEHPARFVLVGSGNPEEGELRPQLVDRFGLCAEVQTLLDLDERVEIIKLREAFDRNPAGFAAKFEGDQQSLRRRLVRARKLAGRVSISKELMRSIAGLCLQLRIDGHRGELTIVRAARALASFEGRRKATEDDVRRVAPISLRHRLRRDPLEPTSGGGERVEQALDKTFSEDKRGVNGNELSSLNNPERTSETSKSNQNNRLNDDHERKVTRPDRGRPAPPPLEARLPDQALVHSSDPVTKQRTANQIARNQRNGTRSSYNFRRGRYSRAVMHSTPDSKIALDATLRAKAINASRNDTDRITKVGRVSTPYTLPPTPCSSDLRFKAFKRKQGTLFIMAIDTSGSMALNRIERAKGALAWLLNRSYIRRDRVALVSFRGQRAEEILQPTQSMSRARRVLDELMMGGTTPLASAIVSTLNIAVRATRQGTESIVLLVFTDGRANVSLRDTETGVRDPKDASIIQHELDQLGAALRKTCVTTLIVDTQNRFTSGGEGRALAERLGARYMLLSSAGTDDNLFTSVKMLAT